MEAVGWDKISPHLAYALAKVYGFKLGKRYVVPGHVVERFLDGTLPLEAVHEEARKRARGRKWRRVTD
ncbi:hypothetical protein [Thermus hydrothermalis]|uniref:hypothetical protein n=1 Tax=Thermus hydrothermalis TaxID=2908148 RepID=UPI001FAA4623|nr:hypothetical protein [Thermus hydrothermalis]